MGDALPDAFLRFAHDSGESWNPKMCGESLDKQCPGDPAHPDPKNGGWFVITNFQFSLGGTSASHSAGAGADAHGKPQGKGAGPQTQRGGSGKTGGQPEHSDEGKFGGVSITMPMQYGSISLMKACTDFAIKNPDDVTKIEQAYIYVRRPGYAGQWAMEGSGQDWFLAIYLWGVTITNYSTSISCEDTFTLNYEKMMLDYWGTNAETNRLDDALRNYDSWLNASDSDKDASS